MAGIKSWYKVDKKLQLGTKDNIILFTIGGILGTDFLLQKKTSKTEFAT